MTMAQLAEALRALGAQAPPFIARLDYEVRVIPPVGPPGLLHVRVKAGLAHHHGEEHVLMVPLEAKTQDEVAAAAAAAAVGFYRAVDACPGCGQRVTVALLHEQRPHARAGPMRTRGGLRAPRGSPGKERSSIPRRGDGGGTAG